VFGRSRCSVFVPLIPLLLKRLPGRLISGWYCHRDPLPSVESVFVRGDLVVDAGEIDGWRLTTGACDPAAPRMLLARVTVAEDRASCDAYSSLSVLAVQGDWDQRAGIIDLARPLLSLSAAEQQVLCAWLIGRRWLAWARAMLSVRTLLGGGTPPIALAEAARQWMLPLATLGGAAAAERLPTIRAGNRHLVYPATIDEALRRGMPHDHRGRPRRRYRL